MFSLLIAHYNNFDYFKDCYSSILNQTVKDFEVIIVDDCSTDNSFEQIQDWVKNDSRFHLFRNDQNKGVGFTKRRCAELAKGDFCGFIDPDDALSEDAIEQSVIKYKHPDVVATHSQFYLCDSGLNVLKVYPNTRKVKNSNTHFFNINFEVNHFFTFRRNMYEKSGGINAELTSAVDQDLYLKMYDLGKLAYISKPLYLYRLHEKGVSQEKSKKGKLNNNWNLVLKNTLERRGMNQVFGDEVKAIENLPKFIFKKENTFLKRLLRKIK